MSDLTLWYDFVNKPGLDPVDAGQGPTLTFSRTSLATFTDNRGIIRAVQSGDPRFNGARMRQNLCTYSNNFVTGWTLSLSPTVTNLSSGTHPEHTPFGYGTTIEDTGAASYQSLISPTTVSLPKASVPLCASLFVLKDSVAAATRFPLMRIVMNAGSSSEYADIAFDTSTGDYQTYSGSTVNPTNISGGVIDWDDNWWRVWLTCENLSTNGATNVTVTTFPAAGANADLTTFSGAALGTITVYGMQLEMYERFPTEYIHNQSSTRNIVWSGGNQLSRYQTRTGGVWVDDPTQSGSWVKPGFLSEGAKSNSCLQSEDFSTTWAATRMSVSTNTALSPAGVTTADSFVEDATASTSHYVSQTLASFTASTTYTFSCYLKAVNRDWVRLQATDLAGTNHSCMYNLGSGTVGSTAGSPSGSGMEYAGNGWWRCWVTFPSNTGATASNIYIVVGEADLDVTLTGNSSTAFYMWGAQVEANPVPTSYIPTTTSLQTRQLELMYSTGLTGGTQTGGDMTMFSKFYARDNWDSGTNRDIFELSDNSAANRMLQYFANGASLGGMYSRLASTTEVGNIGSITGIDFSDHVAFVSKVETNDSNNWIEGALLGAGDFVVTTHTTELTKIALGHSFSGGEAFFGVIAEVRLYKTSTEDAENALLSSEKGEGVYRPYR